MAQERLRRGGVKHAIVMRGSRQRRWIKLLKDFDCSIEYHPGKANVVANALSCRIVSDLRAMFARFSLYDDGSVLAELQVRPTCIEKIKEKQLRDESLDSDLRQSILREAPGNPYAMHPSGNKLYQDLRELYWWPGLKLEVIDYVSKCLTCQQVKAEHQLPSRLLQHVKIPLWKGSWEDYLPLAEFTYNDSYQSSIRMASYEALYGHRCRTPTCWTELGERRILGPELVADTEDKVKLIRDRLKEAFHRQKSYADLKRKEIEYSVGDYVFLKLELPPELDRIHDVFYVSMLRRYHSDPSHVMPIEEIEVRPDLTIEEEPVEILERDIKVLRKKYVPLVKVLLHYHGVEEATWELEETI
ncbi:uncharacterized protein LOC108468498 [Gossypium arboreum]|uniref:uncharacterized protein LOC108468498 n=1 Tax=Gossypium arboreum TaxID=29729 RepID=UPI000818F421|nr:uncharacterized protein LOC108468498 [Gossypium arboreum]